MSGMTVRVAVVQATPVVLDAPASVAKACALIEEAGANGARLIALPEGFIPIMPRSCWGHHYGLIVSPKSVELHRRLWDNAVEIPGPHTEALGEAARRAGAWVGIGVNERDVRRPGTLWNTLLWLAPDGSVAGRHRKLMPTMHERIFWGQGAGDDLDPMETPFGRVGGLICWENFMPAARRRRRTVLGCALPARVRQPHRTVRTLGSFVAAGHAQILHGSGDGCLRQADMLKHGLGLISIIR